MSFKNAVALVLLSLGAVSTVFAQQSVEGLLNEVDSALGTRDDTSKQETRRKENKTKKKSLEPAAPKVTPSPQPEKKEETIEVQKQLPNTKIDRILSLEDDDAKRASRTAEPRLGLSAKGTVGWIGKTYRLSKDDDHFSPKGGSFVAGGEIAAELWWTLPWESLAAHKPRLFSQAAVGVLRGKVQTNREGVQSNLFEAEDTILPLDIVFGMSLAPLSAPFDTIRFELGLGPSFEFLNQSGRGYYDSTSGFFSSEVFLLGASYELSPQWAVRAQFRSKGILGIPSGTRASGQSIAAGFTYFFTHQ